MIRARGCGQCKGGLVSGCALSDPLREFDGDAFGSLDKDESARVEIHDFVSRLESARRELGDFRLDVVHREAYVIEAELV